MMFVSFYLLSNSNCLYSNGMLGFKMRLGTEIFLWKGYFICLIVKICKQAMLTFKKYSEDENISKNLPSCMIADHMAANLRQMQLR